MTVEINVDNFDETTSTSGIVVIDCWAPRCRNCDGFGEAFRRVAARNPDPVFGTLNVQEQKDLRDALGIRHVPSLLLYRDGILLFNQPGSYDDATLDSIIAQAEGLDMDRVRAELASAQTD